MTTNNECENCKGCPDCMPLSDSQADNLADALKGLTNDRKYCEIAQRRLAQEYLFT